MPVNFIEDEEQAAGAVHFIEDEVQPSTVAAEALKEPHNYEPATPPVTGNRTPIFGPGLPIPYPTTAAAPPLPSPLSPEPFVAIPKAPPVEQVPPTAVEKGLLSGNLLGVGAEKLLGQEGAVQFGRSGVNLAGSLPEFLTSPLGITATAVGRVAPTLVAGAFAVDTLRKLPDAIADVAENWGEMTKPQKIDAITQLAGQTALGVGLGVHTVKGGLKAGERFASKREAAARAKTEAAGPGPIPEATPEEVAAVKAKIDELQKAEQAPANVPVEQPAPPVQPPVEQATQPTPVESAAPKWITDNVQAVMSTLPESVKQNIIRLAAERKTAQEIATELGYDKEMVLLARLGLGIPSQQIAGPMGVGRPNPEFEVWLKKQPTPAKEVTPDAQEVQRKEAVTQPQPSPAAKQPWEMTKDEWENTEIGFGAKERPVRFQFHKEEVRTALSEGKPVPSEVIADYPDLKPSTPPARGTEKPTASPVVETPPTTPPSEAGGGSSITDAWFR